MYKPTIFFSHSSIDRDYVLELQKAINERTSGTVNIFQSSDGESIPFGNNWVHKIEENLNKAKVMFVFVSPKSLTSSWIYFEAGFAYSKGVRVIPIGIKGVDVGKLSPPLNLLQGFNINSEAGVNNILKILNDEFTCAFPMSFNNNEFKKISMLDESSPQNIAGIIEKIDYIKLNLPNHFGKEGSDEENRISTSAINILQDKLNKIGAQSAFSGMNTLYAHGLVASVLGSDKNLQISIKIDPFMLSVYETLISGIFTEIYEKELEYAWMYIVFNKNVSLETTDFKISSRLSTSDISLLETNGNFYKFRDVKFTIEPKNVDTYSGRTVQEQNLRVVYRLGHFSLDEFYELIKTLIDSKVISNVI